MAQLVGEFCVMCQQRIGWVGDSHFCEVCGQPVHNACTKPSELTERSCPACGAPTTTVLTRSGGVPPSQSEVGDAGTEATDRVPAKPPADDGLLASLKRICGALFLVFGVVLMAITIYLEFVAGGLRRKGFACFSAISWTLVMVGFAWVRSKPAFPDTANTQPGDRDG